jgi:hypothetical protein
MAATAVIASPSSAAGGEKTYSATINAKCLLGPGLLNTKGNATIKISAVGPESVEYGQTLALHSATASIEIPANWRTKLAAEGAIGAAGRLTELEASLVGGEQEGKTNSINFATPPEYPTGLPFESSVESETPEFWDIPTGSEASGTTFNFAPITVTGESGTNLAVKVGIEEGYEGAHDTGKGIQFVFTGYNSEGEAAGLTKNVKIGCTSLGATALAETPIFDQCPATTTTSEPLTVTPTGGPTGGGTAVTITGTNLAGTTEVYFGATKATSFEQRSGTEIQAIAPPGAGMVHVYVYGSRERCGPRTGEGSYTYAGETSTSTSTRTETCTTATVPAPEITAVEPDQGPAAGGTSVTIHGRWFSGLINVGSVSSVTFGETAAASWHQVSENLITAVTPPGTGTVGIHVSVHTACGTSTSMPYPFHYYEPSLPQPTVASVTPDFGGAGIAGGATVAIRGTNFVGVHAVRFGAADATNIQVVSPTELTAVVPFAGYELGGSTVDVTVETTAGTSAVNNADEFEYELCYPLYPILKSLSPNHGPEAGGTPVAISIEYPYRYSISSVSFGGKAATVGMGWVTPPGVGTVQVAVYGHNACGNWSLASTYTYEPPPTVTSITPAYGYTTGGTPVTISGSGFVSGAAATIGGKPMSEVSVNTTAQTITGKTPPGTVGSSPVVVSDQYGSSTESSPGVSFTYLSPIETTEYKSWPLSGSITPKYLGQAITLPTGSTFSGSGELNDETGVGTEKGSVSVPAFKSTVKLLGIPVSLGLSLTQAGPLEGSISQSTVGNETLKMPAKLNLGITSVGILGLTLATSCTTTEPLSMALGATAPQHELLKAGFSGAGTTKVASLRCTGGFLGAAIGQLFAAMLSGPGSGYSLAVKAPGS